MNNMATNQLLSATPVSSTQPQPPPSAGFIQVTGCSSSSSSSGSGGAAEPDFMDVCHNNSDRVTLRNIVYSLWAMNKGAESSSATFTQAGGGVGGGAGGASCYLVRVSFPLTSSFLFINVCKKPGLQRSPPAGPRVPLAGLLWSWLPYFCAGHAAGVRRVPPAHRLHLCARGAGRRSTGAAE